MGEIIFTESAFNHGFVESDFFELISRRYIKLRSQRGLPDIYELLGQNLAGDYLHVIYRTQKISKRIKIFYMNTMTDSQKQRYRRLMKK